MAAMGPFGAGNRVAVAVSGGADSMALATLLTEWGQPTALIVDHGLRAGSGDEAMITASRLAAQGIAGRVLPIDLAPGPALGARARVARYAALSVACRDEGLTDLLVAHHAQDQAETLLLRRQAGSGPAGLAGMAAITHTESVRVLRPLLSVMPGRLRATLLDAGVEWVEDPTNHDLTTPRARLRLAFQEGMVADIPALCSKTYQSGLGRHAVEAAVAAELARNTVLLPNGIAVVSGSAMTAAALSALIWTVSGMEHPPARGSVERLCGQLQPATLHGAAILRTQGGWLIGREAAVQAASRLARAGDVWDRRFRLLSCPPGELAIGPLGDDAARLRRWSDLPAALLHTLPAIRLNQKLFAVPHLSYPDRETCDAVPILFCPSRPAAPAPFAFGRMDGDAEAA